MFYLRLRDVGLLIAAMAIFQNSILILLTPSISPNKRLQLVLSYIKGFRFTVLCFGLWVKPCLGSQIGTHVIVFGCQFLEC